MTNARIQPSSLVAFGHMFTLTSSCNARYSEPGFTGPTIELTNTHATNCNSTEPHIYSKGKW